MVTTVSGIHMEVGQSLQHHVQDRIDTGVKKYLLDITQAKVNFSKRSYLYHADIMIHDTHMGLVKAESESDDVYAAFDTAIIKIEKQLRKYKGKIHKHVKSAKETAPEAFLAGTKYILDSSTKDNHDEHHEHEPVTIAERPANIEKLTVSEAIMKMDLAHLPALLFINKLNDRLNVVYHRVDGNISWVDPGNIGK
jgi:ribosomal subunit interface protein